MDAVEILLMGIVGLFVLVFLILDSLYPDQALKKSVGDAQNLAAAGDRGVSDEFVDDWEGVERRELEKNFGEVIVFENSQKWNGGGGGGGISQYVMVELYGLQNVALQGPCNVSQPMALNLSAR